MDVFPKRTFSKRTFPKKDVFKKDVFSTPITDVYTAGQGSPHHIMNGL